MKDLAYFSAKKAHSKNDSFRKSRDFIDKLEHIDQMWEHLNHKNGNISSMFSFDVHVHYMFTFEQKSKKQEENLCLQKPVSNIQK